MYMYMYVHVHVCTCIYMYVCMHAAVCAKCVFTRIFWGSPTLYVHVVNLALRTRLLTP